MSVDITRPMPIGGTHPPSMGASVVGPTSANVSRQSGVAYPPGRQPVVGVDDTSGTARPTSADVGYQPVSTATAYQPPTWTGPKPAYASQYAAVRTDVAVHTSAETACPVTAFVGSSCYVATVVASAPRPMTGLGHHALWAPNSDTSGP